jgi:hypothetical protein
VYDGPQQFRLEGKEMPLSSEHNKFLKKYRNALGSLQKEVVKAKKERGKRKKGDSQGRHQNR